MSGLVGLEPGSVVHHSVGKREFSSFLRSHIISIVRKTFDTGKFLASCFYTKGRQTMCTTLLEMNSLSLFLCGWVVDGIGAGEEQLYFPSVLNRIHFL